MKSRRIANLVVVLCLLMLLPAAASAQTVSSGSIAGVVKDSSGAVLPGVTVEASSPALIEKVRTVVTDDQGLYRIVDLRPGTYAVTFTLPGFSPFRRDGIELSTAFTATVNGQLSVGTIAETVTVSGEASIVDTQNVMQQKVFTRRALDAIPTGQNMNQYAALIPGAVVPAAAQDVGGTRSEGVAGFSIHGARTSDMQLMVDGTRINSTRAAGSRMFSLNRASAQEVTVEVGGMSAESESGGVHLNIVPREGGNRFSVYFNSSYSNGDLQSGNVTDALRARGVKTDVKIEKVYDVGGGVGGPVVKDKLWFYVGHRWWGTKAFVAGNYFNATQGTLFYAQDLSRPAYTDDFARDDSLRLTWQAAQKHRLNVTLTNQDNCNCFFNLGNGGLAPEATANHRYAPNYTAQVAWSYPVTNRLLLEAGGAMVNASFDPRPIGAGGTDTISVLELSTNVRYGSRATALGATGDYGRKVGKQSTQRFYVSYITGSHAFKTGIFSQEAWRDDSHRINQDVDYSFQNGVPASLRLWATPSGDLERLMPNLGVFTQDQWTLGKLTLNLGARFDYLNQYVPEQHLPAGRFVPAREFAAVRNVPNWRDISPRLGAAYDLFGNGRTAFKVFLGRYVQREEITLAVANNPVTTSVNSATRTWNDANRNYVPDCALTLSAANGECGPLNPSTFGQTRIQTRYSDEALRGFGNRPYNWQSSVSIQHELRPGLAVNVGYFRTRYGNFTMTENLALTRADFDPYCFTVPADARLPGGGGRQICGLYDVKPAKFGALDNLINLASSYGKQTEIFNGIDATLSARFRQGGQFSGGLSTGRTTYDTCDLNNLPQVQPLSVQGVAASTTVVTPRSPEFCHATLPWSGQTQVKFFVVYPLPWGLQPSMTFQSLPGIPIAASYVARNPEIAPSLGRSLSAGPNGFATVDVIPPNTMREDRINQIDIRLSRIFRFGRTRVQGIFDVYNVTNASSVLAINTRWGPAWRDVQQILPGRLLKAGMQLEF